MEAELVHLLVTSALVHIQEVKQIWQVMFLGVWSPTVPLMNIWSKSLQEAELSVFIIYLLKYHH